jgi:integrase
VKECVDDFVAAKKSEGLSKVYVDSRRHMLTRFSKAFACDLRDVTTDAIRKYIDSIKNIGLVCRNNHVKAVRGLFNHAKSQGWISRNESTSADGIGLAKIKIEKVEIFTPAEIAALLAAADEDFRAVLVLIVFCGVRREEVKRLDWSVLNFDAGTITLPANVTKTGRARKIDLQPAAKGFLEPCKGRKGVIFGVHQERRLEKTVGAVKAQLPEFKWKKNALRHSFCSYRLEDCRNAGQVALEAGNSAAIVMRHYHEVVSADAAKAFWALRPAN